MSRQALAFGLVATLVLSTLFFSPVYKAEEDEEFYEDQPYLYYDLHIHELDSKNMNCNTDSFMGNVYLQRAPSFDLNRHNSFGVASYHFEDENNVYINWENFGWFFGEDWIMDNGERIPNQKQFAETYFDYDNRTFLGILNFSEPEKTTVDGISRLEYTMVFSEDHTSIVDGFVDLYDSNDTFIATASYGLTEVEGLVYQCDVQEFSGSVYMRREYSVEESKKFRDLLVKSYKISVLDEQYRTEVRTVINDISNGTKDSQKGIEEISNLTSKYDGQAKMYLDYEIPMDQLITLEMVTWVRDNFEIESMVDGVPRGHMSNRITNVNETIKNELNAPQKLAVIENEMLLDHYERDVTTDAGPTLEIDGVQAVWADWEFESVGPTSHLIGGLSSNKDARLWIGQWMHIDFPNAPHTSGNHTLKFEWPDEDFKGKETNFHVSLGYGEVFTNIITESTDFWPNENDNWYKPPFERFGFAAENGTVGNFEATFGQGFADYMSYDWYEAVDYAETLSYEGVSGHLATITSKEEAEMIYSLLDGQSYWLGGFHNMDNPDYSEPSNGWEWVTGEKFTHDFWAEGEPNEAGPEDCLEVWGFDKVLNDNRCHLEWMGIVVEYEMNGTNHYEAYIPQWHWDVQNETDILTYVIAVPLTDEERNEILKEEGDPDADDDGIVDIFDKDDDNDGIEDEDDMDDDNDGIDDDSDSCPGTKVNDPVDAEGCSASQIIGEISDDEGLPGFGFLLAVSSILALVISRRPMH